MKNSGYDIRRHAYAGDGRSAVALAENGAARNEDVGARIHNERGGLFVYAAVDLDIAARGSTAL